LVVARRADNDDVLVELADGRVAVLHLVWQDGGRPMHSPPQSLQSFLKDATDASVHTEI
jgi:hypothetical protein